MNVLDRNETRRVFTKAFFGALLHKDSFTEDTKNKITKFITATSRIEKSSDPLQLWKSYEARFPTIAEVVRDVLAIQVLSKASKSLFSQARLLIDPNKQFLSDGRTGANFLIRVENAF